MAETDTTSSAASASTSSVCETATDTTSSAAGASTSSVCGTATDTTSSAASASTSSVCVELQQILLVVQLVCETPTIISRLCAALSSERGRLNCLVICDGKRVIFY